MLFIVYNEKENNYKYINNGGGLVWFDWVEVGLR